MLEGYDVLEQPGTRELGTGCRRRYSPISCLRYRMIFGIPDRVHFYSVLDSRWWVGIRSVEDDERLPAHHHLDMHCLQIVETSPAPKMLVNTNEILT